MKDLLAVKSREEILADPWLVRGLKYALQTAVEAVIDLSYHIAARNFGHAPSDARDAVRILAEGGLVPAGNIPVYSAMIGFRNRVVHGYQEVSPERVYEMALNELEDFDRFLADISPVLVYKGGGGK
jgi:uncharacterized protein YutE (UPF0331/DUF86 family)